MCDMTLQLDQAAETYPEQRRHAQWWNGTRIILLFWLKTFFFYFVFMSQNFFDRRKAHNTYANSGFCILHLSFMWYKYIIEHSGTPPPTPQQWSELNFLTCTKKISDFVLFSVALVETKHIKV